VESNTVVVVGGGVFGVTAALELRARGHTVTLVDPGPLPHPDASSTDISKVIRADYGSDVFYARLVRECMNGWDDWNAMAGRALYHETGYLILARDEMSPGGFEHDSWEVLSEMGHPIDRLTPGELSRRFPSWSEDRYPDGYFNHRAGWAESGNVVSWLLGRAREAGVRLVEGQTMASLRENGSRVSGIVTEGGEEHAADVVVVAAGAWTPTLLPWLEDALRCVGQPVYHFQPTDVTGFQADLFPPWSADVANTGWYGFPIQPDGVLKVANHGNGIRIDPRGEKVVSLENDEKFETFFVETLGGDVGTAIVKRRLCLYCDSWDGDFWIDRDPDREGLVVAAGGSGHGFKCAPMLGKITADVVEGRENPWASRFAWRTPGSLTTEAARYTSTEP
jgi:glycine/D-amino acid oxidase-like deaminating enzyme